MFIEFVLGAFALVALALAFVLPALWKEARGSALALLAAFPLAAFGLYAVFGYPEALDPARHQAPETIDEAVRQLEARLDEDADSLDGWVLLGRARKTMGRQIERAGDAVAAQVHFSQSLRAFRRALELAPDDTDLMVEVAESMSLADADRQFHPESVLLLERALAANPEHQRGLWFRGIAAFQAGDAAAAVAHWETLLPMVDATTAEALRPQIDEARKAAGLPTVEPSAGSDGQPGLRLRIEADPAELAALPEAAVLFVFARDPEQTAGPPLAVRRIETPVFPLEISLTDADRLLPSAPPLGMRPLLVQARYAVSGSVEEQSGDLVAGPVAAQAGSDLVATVLRLAPRTEP